jgi:5-amino-6-(5-phosphoribosylamino)uracil reductase
MIDWAARFSSFAERKEREARAAQTAPFVTLIDASTPDLLAVGDAWSRRLFDGPFFLSPAPSADLPAVGLVVVESSDGNTVAADPSTLGGGESDKHLIYEGLSRVAADGVLAGAGTVRGGNIVFSVWRDELVALRARLGKLRHPIQIVATVHGIALEDGLIFNVPDVRVIIVTVQAGADAMRQQLAARPWITPIVMKQAADLPLAFGELRRLGIERISAVGGRTLAAAMLDHALVQDLYLTTSAREAGVPHTPLYAKPLRERLVVSKHGTGPDAGVMFRHARLS